jgi:site-specific DNA recombinase
MARTRRPRTGPLRARRYGRVSTEKQNEPGAVSIEDQDRITAAYVARKEGWEDGGFTHDEYTGTTDNRDEWQQIMAECRAGEWDVVVCAKLNRFARDARTGLNLVYELNQLGVDVVLCDIDLDTTSPSGKAMLTVMLAFAQFDRDNLVQTMALGQYGKARQGGWPSSAAGAPFGLRKEGTGRAARLVEDEPEAATIRKAAALLVDERMDLAEACRTLNALGMLPRKSPHWYPDLLRQVMSERARMGEVIWGKPNRIASRNGGTPYGTPTPIEGVPAVLTPERFELVQQALHRRSPAALAASRTYPLSLRTTSPCGQPYYGVSRNDVGLVQYRCKGIKWRADPGWRSCGCTRLEATALEARVWGEVSALLSDEARLRELAHAYLGIAGEQEDAHGGELARLESQIALLQDRLSAGVAGYIKAGLDPETIASAVAQLEDELSTLRVRRDDIARLLADGKAQTASLDQLGKLAALAAGRLADASLEFQDEVLALLDVRVTVLDASKTPALRIEGTICSSEMLDPSEARNPAGQGPRRGWDPATAT